MHFVLAERFVLIHFARLSRGILAFGINLNRIEYSLINVQCTVPWWSGQLAAYLA